MKKITILFFLMGIIPQLGFGYPVLEIGAFKEKRKNASDWSESSAVVVRDDLMNVSPATLYDLFRHKPEYSDVKRLFYVEREGCVVVGEELPQDFVPYFPKQGDLVVSGKVFAKEIISPALNDQLRTLREEIAELKAAFSKLKFNNKRD